MIAESPLYDESDPKKVAEFYARFLLDWKQELKKGMEIYVETEDKEGLSMAYCAGRAAMLQAMMQYFETFGHKAWLDLRLFHNEKHDYQHYSYHLERQVRKESDIFGIPPFLISVSIVQLAAIS